MLIYIFSGFRGLLALIEMHRIGELIIKKIVEIVSFCNLVQHKSGDVPWRSALKIWFQWCRIHPAKRKPVDYLVVR